MKERFLSACLIVAVFLILVFFSGYPFVMQITIALLSAAALSEVLIVTKYVESKSLMIISIIFALAIPFIPDFKRAAFTGGIFVFAMILFITLISAYKTFRLEHLSVVFLMSIIIPFFYSTIIYSRQMPMGTYYLIAIFLCAWSTDSGGYIFGKLYGHHKLTPQISPKKTVAGAVGGLVASMGMMICLGFAAQILEGVKVNYISLCVFAVLGSIVAIIGDLTASIIKRNFNVKDFGSIIPGHGGIMDRFDSVLFVAPLLYLYLNMTIIIFNNFGIDVTIFSI